MVKEKRQITIVEVAVTYISLGWSIVMLTNNTIFERSQNFERLELIVQKEWIVGVVCLVLATIKIVAMLLNIRRFRWLGLILSAMFWALVSATFLLSGSEFSFNTGFIVYSAIAILCLWTSKEVMTRD